MNHQPFLTCVAYRRCDGHAGLGWRLVMFVVRTRQGRSTTLNMKAIVASAGGPHNCQEYQRSVRPGEQGANEPTEPN